MSISITPSEILTRVVSWIIDKVEAIYDAVFGDIQFEVLWNWLPNDIQTACNTLIIIFFAIVIWKVIKDFIPFF